MKKLQRFPDETPRRPASCRHAPAGLFNGRICARGSVIAFLADRQNAITKKSACRLRPHGPTQAPFTLPLSLLLSVPTASLDSLPPPGCPDAAHFLPRRRGGPQSPTPRPIHHFSVSRTADRRHLKTPATPHTSPTLPREHNGPSPTPCHSPTPGRPAALTPHVSQRRRTSLPERLFLTGIS